MTKAAEELSAVEQRANLVLASDTLMGDIRDAILDRLKAMPKPWTVMSENEQRDLIYGVENAAQNLIRQAALLMAANGYPTINGQVESSTIKDDIKTVVRVSKTHGDRLALLDAAGHPCIIVIADIAQFLGERAPAEPDKDEPVLELGAEYTSQDGDGMEASNVKPLKGKNKPADVE